MGTSTITATVRSTLDPDRHTAVFAFVERLDEHHPGEPCWYLPFIGVDPPCQGRGYGSRLLVHGLTRCDRDHLPAYLEATSARSRALYERHGFVVTGEIQAGDSPPLWPMMRAAR
jgi:ribosomal protein S18 acetylase RimI-like enzyme